MNCLLPNKIEPTGADSPLLRQKHTESMSRVIRETGTPDSWAALKTRAPSMWILILFSLQISDNSSRNSNGKIYKIHERSTNSQKFPLKISCLNLLH